VAAKKKTIEIAVVAALITGACALGAALINRSNKSSAQNQQTVTVGNSNSETSIAVANGSNSQAIIDRSLHFTQTNAGQGQIIAPSQPISLTQIFNNNYSSTNIPDTGLREWVSNLDVRLNTNTSDIHVTRDELVNLTKLLAKLDERTSDIEKLPDGRTRLGGVIGGTPKIIAEEVTNALNYFNAGAYSNSLKVAIAGIENIKASVRSNVFQQEIVVTPHGKGVLYGLAALSAQHLQSNSIANEFALKAFEEEPVSQNRQILITTFINNGMRAYKNSQPSNALVSFRAAVTNYEALSSNDIELQKIDVLKMYGYGASAAMQLGDTNLLAEYATKTTELLSQTNWDMMQPPPKIK